MEVRFVTKLIFFLLTLETSSADDEERRPYKCRQPVPQKCVNSTGIRINKYSDLYKLKFCSDYQCATVNESGYEMILNCEDVCSACTLLGTALGQINCRSNSHCEMSIDTVLNNFCATLALMTPVFINHYPSTLCNSASPTTTVSMFGEQSITGSQHITQKCRIVDTKITPSYTLPESMVVQHISTLKSQDSASVQYKSPPIVALATLFTICVVLLVVVTIALVWTRWKAKGPQLELSVLEHKKEVVSTDDDKDEKYLENPAYEDTYVHVTTPHARTTSPEKQLDELSSLDSTYEVVGEALLQGQLENGDAYDALNRELTSGFTVSIKAASTSQIDGNYSQIGLRDRDIENNYHVITIDNFDSDQSTYYESFSL